eukprot:7617541-Pyramimonas_sp.AAC.1
MCIRDSLSRGGPKSMGPPRGGGQGPQLPQTSHNWGSCGSVGRQRVKPYRVNHSRQRVKAVGAR